MSEKNDFALVTRPPSAVEKRQPGARRILSGMVADTLALADREQVNPAKARFRIGEYEWCEPDYRQLLIWAKALAFKPEQVIKDLLRATGRIHVGGKAYPWSTRFGDGKLLMVNWHLDSPLENFEWVEGLGTTHLCISSDEENLRTLAPNLPSLTHLTAGMILRMRYRPESPFADCGFGLGLTRLDLSRTPKLRILECASNQLLNLNLSAIPSLTALRCSENEIKELDLRQVPRLIWLKCASNKLSNLDLSGVPNLARLECEENDIQELDIRPLLHLKHLTFDRDKTQLVQRPDQKF